MTKLVYRGVEHDDQQQKPEERIIRRPELVYRGVEHNGVRTLEPEHKELGDARMIVSSTCLRKLKE